MVRAQSLRGYRELVSDLEGDPTRLLRKAGIEPGALDQLTAFIRFDLLTELLEDSAADLRCPDFGLRLAERQDIGILGTLAVAMRYSATVGEALQCASKYLHVYNAAIAFRITSGGRRGQTLLAFNLLAGPYLRWAQTAEHGIGLTWRIITLLTEGRCQLQQVRFPHPAVGAEESYRYRFDAPLVFGADQAALSVATKGLKLPISGDNAELHHLATRYLDGQLAPGRKSFDVQVRQATESLLGTGSCSHREVARALYMHPRTLQRRLRQQGTSFEGIKDATRRDLAERYLSQVDVPLTQITTLLDYSEQSALGRSCRRWFGATPLQMRSRLSAHPRLS